MSYQVNRTAVQRCLAQNWIELWNGPNPMWLNDRHLQARCRRVVDDILSLLAGRAQPIVLDYGCGEALEAHRMAAVTGRFFLYDAPPAILDRVKTRYAATPNVEVIGDEKLRAIPKASLDVVVMSSVIQYLSPTQFETLLERFFAQLKPAGEILIGDVIPPTGDHVDYALTLLADGLRYGYFWAAVRGMIVMRFSHYWDLKRSLRYSYYSEEAIVALLRRHGFEPERLPLNIGGGRGRMTFRARKPDR